MLEIIHLVTFSSLFLFLIYFPASSSNADPDYEEDILDEDILDQESRN